VGGCISDTFYVAYPTVVVIVIETEDLQSPRQMLVFDFPPSSF
jgi:hypothetical protein